MLDNPQYIEKSILGGKIQPNYSKKIINELETTSIKDRIIHKMKITPPKLVNYDESERKALGEYFEKRYGKKPIIVIDNSDNRTAEELDAWFLQDLQKFAKEEEEYYRTHPEPWKENTIKGLDEIDLKEFKDIINQQFYDRELEEKIQRDSNIYVSNKNTRKNIRSKTNKTNKKLKIDYKNSLISNGLFSG